MCTTSGIGGPEGILVSPIVLDSDEKWTEVPPFSLLLWVRWYVWNTKYLPCTWTHFLPSSSGLLLFVMWGLPVGVQDRLDPQPINNVVKTWLSRELACRCPIERTGIKRNNIPVGLESVVQIAFLLRRVMFPSRFQQVLTPLGLHNPGALEHYNVFYGGNLTIRWFPVEQPPCIMVVVPGFLVPNPSAYSHERTSERDRELF